MNEHSPKAHPRSSRPDLRAGLAHGRWVGAGRGTWTKAAPRRRPGTPESQTSRMKESYLGSMSAKRSPVKPHTPVLHAGGEQFV